MALKLRHKPRWMRRSPHWQTWLWHCGAMAASLSSYHPLDDEDPVHEYRAQAGVDWLGVQTPEDVAIKSNSLEALSAEAKAVMELVLQTPTEALRLITAPRTRKITKRRVRMYLVDGLGWRPVDVDRVFNEIQTYVGDL